MARSVWQKLLSASQFYREQNPAVKPRRRTGNSNVRPRLKTRHLTSQKRQAVLPRLSRRLARVIDAYAQMRCVLPTHPQQLLLQLQLLRTRIPTPRLPLQSPPTTARSTRTITTVAMPPKKPNTAPKKPAAATNGKQSTLRYVKTQTTLG